MNDFMQIVAATLWPVMLAIITIIGAALFLMDEIALAWWKEE